MVTFYNMHRTETKKTSIILASTIGQLLLRTFLPSQQLFHYEPFSRQISAVSCKYNTTNCLLLLHASNIYCFPPNRNYLPQSIYILLYISLILFLMLCSNYHPQSKYYHMHCILLTFHKYQVATTSTASLYLM